MSIITATPAFVRTACRTCQQKFLIGQTIVATVDGFRHIGCHNGNSWTGEN